MIVQKDFITKLKEFGLNSYEAKLWVALLSRGMSSAGELSEISNVPRSRTYDVLESLEKKGFIVVKIGKPIKYIAVSPTEVVERVKKRVQNEADRKSKHLEDLKTTSTLKELDSLYSQGVEKLDITDMTAAFRGRKRLYEGLSTIIKKAKKDVIIATNSRGVLRKLSSLKSDIKNLDKKGIDVKILTNKDDKKIKKILSNKDFSHLKIKHSDNEFRFVIVDDQHLVFMITDDSTHSDYDSGVWVNSEYFVKQFKKFVDNEWTKSKEF